MHNVENTLIHQILCMLANQLSCSGCRSGVGSCNLKPQRQGSGRVISELQLLGIQIYILCPLGLPSADLTQGLPRFVSVWIGLMPVAGENIRYNNQ